MLTTKKGVRAQQKLHSQIAEFRETFRIFDSNGNGEIDAKELHEAFKLLGLGFGLDQAHQVVNDIRLVGGAAEKAGAMHTINQAAPLDAAEIRSEGSFNFVDFCRMVVNPVGDLQLQIKHALQDMREALYLMGADDRSNITVKAFMTVLQVCLPIPGDAD